MKTRQCGRLTGRRRRRSTRSATSRWGAGWRFLWICMVRRGGVVEAHCVKKGQERLTRQLCVGRAAPGRGDGVSREDSGGAAALEQAAVRHHWVGPPREGRQGQDWQGGAHVFGRVEVRVPRVFHQRRVGAKWWWWWRRRR